MQERSAFDFGGNRIVRQSEPMKIGKHEWRLTLYRFLDTCGIAAKPCRTWSPPFRRSHSGPWPRYLVQSPLTRFSSS